MIDTQKVYEYIKAIGNYDEEEIAETVPLDNTGVTREEFNELMKKVEIMNQIFYNYEKF